MFDPFCGSGTAVMEFARPVDIVLTNPPYVRDS